MIARTILITGLLLLALMTSGCVYDPYYRGYYGYGYYDGSYDSYPRYYRHRPYHYDPYWRYYR